MDGFGAGTVDEGWPPPRVRRGKGGSTSRTPGTRIKGAVAHLASPLKWAVRGVRGSPHGHVHGQSQGGSGTPPQRFQPPRRHRIRSIDQVQVGVDTSLTLPLGPWILHPRCAMPWRSTWKQLMPMVLLLQIRSNATASLLTAIPSPLALLPFSRFLPTNNAPHNKGTSRHWQRLVWQGGAGS